MKSKQELRPIWQIALLFLPWCLYLLCLPARAYCNWMDGGMQFKNVAMDDYPR